eukprot:TRINITY_DN5780_c0_g1_i1.p1 TRINITY_DN5780_c0_g1~~TRINITY_DN5780_c0_g1_i1.p1  ORF type:complete len:313 (+),score=81.97 TRINITY_DN5780_c0_g1_i1:62-1000(+)
MSQCDVNFTDSHVKLSDSFRVKFTKNNLFIFVVMSVANPIIITSVSSSVVKNTVSPGVLAPGDGAPLSTASAILPDEDVKAAELLKAMEEDFGKIKDQKKRVLLREYYDAAERGDLNALKKVATLLPLDALKGQDEDDNYGWTALHYAAYRGSLGEISFLVETVKIPVDSVDKSLRTALHIAVCGGRLEAIELLLRLGANVDAKDKTAWAPLHIAAFRMNETVVRYLVEQAGADVEAICSFGSVAHLAASSKEMLEILEKGKKNMNYRKTESSALGAGGVSLTPGKTPVQPGTSPASAGPSPAGTPKNNVKQ